MRVAFFVILGLFICSLLGSTAMSFFHSLNEDLHTLQTETASTVFGTLTIIFFVGSIITGIPTIMGN